MAYYDDIYTVAAGNYGIFTRADAQALGISDKELSRIASGKRLRRIGHGVYKLTRYVPGPNDHFAEAVAIVGKGAYLYGFSVLALFELAPIASDKIFVASPRRVRRRLPENLELVKVDDTASAAGWPTRYERIPSQTVAEAIRVCANEMTKDQLADTVSIARAKGILTAGEERALLDGDRTGNRTGDRDSSAPLV